MSGVMDVLRCDQSDASEFRDGFYPEAKASRLHAESVAALAAVAELVEAAMPFTALMQKHVNSDSTGKPYEESRPVFAINDALITVGDIRKLCGAITAIRGELGNG